MKRNGLGGWCMKRNGLGGWKLQQQQNYYSSVSTLTDSVGRREERGTWQTIQQRSSLRHCFRKALLSSSDMGRYVQSLSPEGPPSRGGDVTVYVWHKPTKLAHSFSFCSCGYFCLYCPLNCISFHKFSRQLSGFWLCSSGLISALLALSTIYPLWESPSALI